MKPRILTVNAGSSSIKVALFEDAADASPLPKAAWSGHADGLGPGLDAHLRIRAADGKMLHDAPLTGDQASQSGALSAILDWLAGQLNAGDIAGIGHRIVHGGTNFTHPVRVDGRVLAELEALSPLAPLHQPHNLAGVRAAIAAFPGVPQVACFDTAFHATQPDVNRRFAIPQALHDSGVRRYGFHGLSYESIVAQLGTLHPALAQARLVVAHLGNGASMCAIEAGRSIATTMSFSPLDGLTMGTRCGHIDAAAVLYLLQDRRMTADALTDLLYRKSGLAGLSGISSDMRELEASAAPAAALAVTHFVEQVLQNLGAMAAAMRGVDAVILTGGIGENAAELRGRILQGAAWLGVQVDAARTQGPRLSADVGTVSAWVLRTDEEAVIARHTARHLA
jgi:acetate kinase